MDSKPNGVASAADFRELAEKASWTEAERVVLPGSGLAVMIRRPTVMYFRMRRAAWPEALLEKIEQLAASQTPGLTGAPPALLTGEEALFLVREDVEMLKHAFVAPGLSLTPGPDEISPHWIGAQDTEFLKKYLGGEVLADGTDLDTFRRTQSGSPADGGGDGGDVRPDASRVADDIAPDVVH